MVGNWDKEVDVLILGYGFAGGIAAIEAHDAGAHALIVEKATYPGGVSIVAGGAIKCISDVEAANRYLIMTSGERVSPGLIRTFAEGLAGNEAYMKKLCQVDGAKLTVMSAAKGLYQGVYPLPGRDSFYCVQVSEVPGFKGYPWVQHIRLAGVNKMKVVFDSVDARHIEVMLSTSALRLLTDAQGTVIGTVAQRQGREINIRARRAVVLATGGFEQNRWLQLQFLQGTPFYSMAPLTHTGDGILMAQKAGAALWHMWHIHGSYGFKLPEYPIAFRHPYGGFRNDKRKMPWVVVDKYGQRYMNEYHPAAQDTNHRPMELFDPDMPGYPRIPSFMVFDEMGRKWGPIGNPLSLGEHIYHWSKDNSAEIEHGWITQAANLRELATKIKAMPENDELIEPEILEETIQRWNSCVHKSKDPLHRPPGTMMPIEIAPFYTIPVWPIITNTQGGPQHNERQQVIDAFGQPIPRLYAAGELGSFFGHLYELGGNLGECVFSGRVAGRNAAAEEPLK